MYSAFVLLATTAVVSTVASASEPSLRGSQDSLVPLVNGRALGLLSVNENGAIPQVAAITTATAQTLIRGFRWIDAATNKPFKNSGSEFLKMGPNEFNGIDLGEFPGGVSIEAIVDINATQKIGSMQFMLEPMLGSFVYIDNTGPRYFMCGNNGTDVAPCLKTLLLPPYDFIVTAYAQANANGAVLAQVRVSLEVKRSPSPDFKVGIVKPSDTPSTPSEDYWSFENSRIVGNGTDISLAKYPTLSFRMVYDSGWDNYKAWGIGSVVFAYDARRGGGNNKGNDRGGMRRTENHEPFTMMGENRTHIHRLTPTLGRHTLSVTIYSRDNGKGQSSTKFFTTNVVP